MPDWGKTHWLACFEGASWQGINKLNVSQMLVGKCVDPAVQRRPTLAYFQAIPLPTAGVLPVEAAAQ